MLAACSSPRGTSAVGHAQGGHPTAPVGAFPLSPLVLLVPSLLPTHLHRCAGALRDVETTSDYSCSLEQRWEILHLPCLGIIEKPHFSLAIHPHTELQDTQHKAPSPSRCLGSRVFPSLQGWFPAPGHATRRAGMGESRTAPQVEQRCSHWKYLHRRTTGGKKALIKPRLHTSTAGMNPASTSLAQLTCQDIIGTLFWAA